MSSHIPKAGAAIFFAAFAIAAILFLVLNNAFGGPQVRFGSQYTLTASFKDSQGLLKKSFILVRGVEAGYVEKIQTVGDSTRISFSIDKKYAPIYRNATVRTGNRTLIGEAYVLLDPGTPAAGALRSGDVLPAKQVLPNVEFDEALRAVDTEGLKSLRGFNVTVADSARSRAAGHQANEGLGEFTGTVKELRRLTQTLRGQEPNISGLVEDSGTVLGEIGSREGTIRTLVADSRTTLAAVAGQQAAVKGALRETPKLLKTGRDTLRDADGFLRDARPVVAAVRRAAPTLTPALRDLGPTAKDATTVVNRLDPLNNAAVPALRAAKPVLDQIGPLTDRLVPTLRNLVPILNYNAPRANDFTALLANISEFLNHGDSRGVYFRYNPFYAAGITEGADTLEGKTFGRNAYPLPNGNLQPDKLTTAYPRLVPAPVP